MAIKIEVDLDKILKELWEQLTYKQALVLKAFLEGKSNKQIIMEVLQKKDPWGSLSNYFKKIRQVLGARTAIEIALVCYNRGYLKIVELEGNPYASDNRDIPAGRRS